MSDYLNQNVLILGMGKSGLAMAEFLRNRGAHILAYDDKLSSLNLHSCPLYNHIHQVDFDKIDFIAASPGVPLAHPVYQKAVEHQIPVVGEMQLGARVIKNQCIGITGANGKSTTTSLIAHILQTAKKKARAVGNIGIPITSVLEEVDADEILVIEISSYQIDTLQTSFLDCGVLLNITPDHLDRYITLENYAKSKFGLQKFIKSKAPFVLSTKLSQTWGSLINRDHLIFYDSLFKKHRHNIEHEHGLTYPYVGPIDEENYSAAIAVCYHYHISDLDIYHGITTFKGLAHRFEFVKEINGIVFYNDSKATNIESVIKAVTSTDKPLVMIMGGEDKGLDYSVLKPYFKNKVKGICLIGHIKDTMAKVFEADFKTVTYSTLKEAVVGAYQMSRTGDMVLLAPGSSSFDMFRNFEHRGEEFKKIVQNLEGEK